ncbi:MAG: hypothetical protein IPJ06_06515 [Saprospiraceae bacterium]|nr:hypothetical protein [Saprospiraceae bacterium]
MTFMNSSFYPFFLLGSLTLFLCSCGSGGGGLTVDAVRTQDSLLTIQANRLMTIQSAIDINGKAMEMPFRGPEQPGDGQEMTTNVNPLEGLPEERLMAFKTAFHNVRSGFDAALITHQSMIQEVTDLQKLLSNAQAELKGDAVTEETKTAFPLVPEQITSLQRRIDALETTVKDVQKAAINLLMSEETLQSGASWLMVNSPMI